MSLVADATEGAPRRRLATRLLWLTLTWNIAEGIIAVGSGIAAGSIALVGFGLDSLIEVTAAGILLWRLSLPVEDESAVRRETIARRIIGMTFIALAGYISAEALYVVVQGIEPDESIVGMGLAAAATLVMPGLGIAKWRNAAALESPALRAEAKETLACSYLSLSLFIGLGANAAFGWWWADIAAAMAMVPWIAKEGVEGLRGEACEEGGEK